MQSTNDHDRWVVKLKNSTIEFSEYLEPFKVYGSVANYNCTISDNLCKECGLPSPCYSSSNHTNLAKADGVYQIGFHYNKENESKRPHNDYLTLHMQNLEQGTEYAAPLALAMFEIAQEKYAYLLEADVIVPVPSFTKDKDVLIKGAALAFELANLFVKKGKKASLVQCIQKTHKVSVQQLEMDGKNQEEKDAAIKDAYQISDDVDLAGKKVLLVDDNLTSGLTAGTCAEKLKAQGAEKVWVFVAGRTK